MRHRHAGCLFFWHLPTPASHLLRHTLLILTLVAGVWQAVAMAAPVRQTPSAPSASPRPDSPRALAMKLHDQGLTALAKRDFPLAIKFLEESLAKDQTYVAPMLGLAEISAIQGNAKRTEALLLRAQSIEPESVQVHTALGRHFMGQQQLDKALAAFKRAIEIDGAAVGPRLGLADLYSLRADNPQMAMEAYRDVLKINPNHFGASMGLAMAMVASQQFADALAQLQKAAQLSPRNPMPHQAMGRIHVAQGNLKEALAAFDVAIRLAPKVASFRLDRADVLMSIGAQARAIVEYESAIRLAPKNVNAHLKLALAHHEMKNVEKAAVEYRKVLELDPSASVPYNNLAWIELDRGGNLEKALSWAREGVRRSPRNAGHMDTLGWVLATLKRYDEAEKVLKEAAGLAPTNSAILYHLGVACAEQGKGKEAVVYLDKAIKTGGLTADEMADARKRLLQLPH